MVLDPPFQFVYKVDSVLVFLLNLNPSLNVLGAEDINGRSALERILPIQYLIAVIINAGIQGIALQEREYLVFNTVVGCLIEIDSGISRLEAALNGFKICHLQAGLIPH